MFRKISVFLLAFCACIFCGACTKGTQSSVISDDREYIPPFDGEVLRVYYCMADPYDWANAYTEFRGDYPEVKVEATKFATAEEMESRLVNEMNTGKAPDVVLFVSSTTLDLYKMAQNGAFLPLDALMQNDEEAQWEKYQPATLAGGKINEKQYFLPFAYRIITALSPQSLLDEYEIVMGETELDRYFSALRDYKKANEIFGEARFLVDLGYWGANPHFGALFLNSSGLNPNPAQLKIQIESSEFRQIIDNLKLVYQSDQDSERNYEKMQQDFLDAAALFLHNANSPDDIYYYRAVYEDIAAQPVGYYALPAAGSAGEYHATMSWFGALTSDCKNEDLGYLFLRYFMDYTGRTGNSVKTSKVLDRARSLMLPVERQTRYGIMEPFVQQDYDALAMLVENIVQCSIPNPKVNTLIHNEFKPYFDGLDSYENCLLLFKNKVNLYLYE